VQTFDEAERRQLLARVVSAQEEERRRIARELHDETAQRLTALLLGLEMLRAESHGRPHTLDQIARLRDIAESLSRDLVRLAVDLRPTSLDDLGLRSALLSYIEAWAQRFAIETHIRLDELDGPRLRPDVETGLYRITQEALTNVARHAQARSASVAVSLTAGDVLLVIADDGVGFDVEAVWNHSAIERRLGLIGMRERAALVGGDVQIESVPGHGTVVIARVPVEGPSAPDSADRPAR
jgi:signal transduction histidine kinase